MDFGYFTLSDNHYDNNPRTPNQFVADIADRGALRRTARHALGLDRRAPFQFARRAVVPDLVLAYVAARTKRIRLAPAVTVLPLHHPIRVAEQWATLDLLSGGRVDFAAGRGYDRREYLPFAGVLRGQPGHLRRRGWSSSASCGRPKAASPTTADTIVRRRADHAEAGAAADPGLCRIVLKAVDRACGAAGLRAYRGAVRGSDELWRAQAGRRPLPRELRPIRHQTRPAHVQLFHPFRRQHGAGGRRSARGRSAITGSASSPPSPAIQNRRRRATATSSTWSRGCSR